MEPVSALSLVCNILQLVEISLEAIKACKQIYNTGTLEHNDRIEEFAVAVIEGHQKLEIELSINKSHSARLKNLARDVNATAQELQKVLNSIKYAKQGRTTSELVKKSIQSLVKRGKIERLKSHLQEQESVLRSGLLKSIYLSFNESDKKQSAALASLEAGQQQTINEFIKRQSIVQDGVVRELEEAESRIIAHNAAASLPVISVIQATESSISAQNQAQTAKTHRIIEHHSSRLEKTILDINVSTTAQLAATEDKIKRDLDTQNVQRELKIRRGQFLDTLYFSAMHQRENMIDGRVNNFGDTFSWIFEESSGHTFAQWLRDGTGLYWINGLAASGKSTLMHFIQLNRASIPSPYNGQTDGDSLILLSFFFYRPSHDSLLKSFEGFWRSLCYQLLTRHTTLLEDIWIDPSAPYKTNAEKNCLLLVDGLDEFADDQIQLLQHLQELPKSYPKMQVCCASRPEALFQLTFKNVPSLRLQDLTARDMRDYCNRQLEGTKAAFLVDRIVHNAQGVFLWAEIVARDLRQASMYDSEEDLVSRLQECPSEIKGLFGLMLQRCDPFYAKRPSLALQSIHLCTQHYINITLLDLIILDLQPLELMESPSQPSHQQKLREKVPNAEQRIISRTAGLVQFKHPPKMASSSFANRPAQNRDIETANRTYAVFMHRTVLDFLSEDQEGREFLQGHSLTDNECMLRIFCAFTWKALHILPYVMDNRAQVLRLAQCIESLPTLPDWYTNHLQSFFDSLTVTMPDTDLRLDQATREALTRDLIVIAYLEDATGPENTVLGYAAEFHLVKFVRWKLDTLASDHSQKLLAFFIVSCCEIAAHMKLTLINVPELELFTEFDFLHKSLRWYALRSSCAAKYLEATDSPLGMVLKLFLQERIQPGIGDRGAAHQTIISRLCSKVLAKNQGTDLGDVDFYLTTQSPGYIKSAKLIPTAAEEREGYRAKRRCTTWTVKWRTSSLLAWLAKETSAETTRPSFEFVSPEGLEESLGVPEECRANISPDDIFGVDANDLSLDLYQLEVDTLNANLDSLVDAELMSLKECGWFMEDGLFVYNSLTQSHLVAIVAEKGDGDGGSDDHTCNNMQAPSAHESHESRHSRFLAELRAKCSAYGLI